MKQALRVMRVMMELVVVVLGVAFGQDPSKNWTVGAPSVATIIGTTYGNASGTATTYYYWLTTNYVAGSVMSYNPAQVTGVTAGDPQVANPITISFNPVGGATSYSVLRTTTSAVPTFPCSCYVGSATANSPSVADIGSGLSSFSPTIIVPASGDIRLNNRDYATPTFEYTINGVTTALAPISGIEALNFFKDDTTIIGTGANNDIQVNTDRTTPNLITEVVDALSPATSTVTGEAYLYNTSLGTSSLDPGLWTVNLYANVSSVAGGRVSTLTDNMYVVIPFITNITTSGAGTTRTATAASGAPFCLGCIQASATTRNASYLQTPQGLYQISARTSDSVVTIVVPTTYTNEAPATSYSTWNKMFGVDTPTITTISPALGLYSVPVAQSTIHIPAIAKFGEIMFATSNNTTTVSYSHNGTFHYSNVQTPIQ